MHFSSRGKQIVSTRGFTLVELLISIAIIGILTSIVLVKYGSFDSTILLKNAAYEIGLNLREAQVRSVSALRADTDSGTEFDAPFGLHFDTGTPQEYILFSDLDTDKTYDTGEEVLTIQIAGSIEISKLCANNDCTLNELDISFKRPEYSPIFSSAATKNAEIKVRSTRSGGSSPEFSVYILELGQISVKTN